MEDEPGVLLARKRKGGLHQRKEAAKRQCEPSAAGCQPSSLAHWLKEQWSWGQLSPQTVQHVAALATRDMASAGATSIPADLLKLAKLGSEGAHQNNCNRDLWALVVDVSKLPKPFPILMPMKVQGGTALQSIFLPHVVFSPFVGALQRALDFFFPSHWQSWLGALLDPLPTPPCNAPTSFEGTGLVILWQLFVSDLTV